MLYKTYRQDMDFTGDKLKEVPVGSVSSGSEFPSLQLYSTKMVRLRLMHRPKANRTGQLPLLQRL